MRLNWATRSLGNICEILDRKRKPITKRNRVAGPYPYYGATGVLDYVNNYIFDEPLVLIGEDGAKWGAGESTAYPIEGKAWVNNHAHVVRPNRSLLLDSWLIYFLNANDLTPYVSGLTVPKLNQGKLKEIPVPLPHVDEQKHIVAILDEAFTSIDAAIANTEKNLANARELFESELERLTECAVKEVGVVELSEVTLSITDGDHMPPPKSNEGIPFITIKNIDKNTREIDFSSTFSVPEEYFISLKANRKPLSGDILYTVTGSYGIPVLVGENDRFCFQRHIGLIRPQPGILSEWLEKVLLSKYVRRQADEGATGTAQKTISLKLLRSFKIPNPKKTDQRSFVERVNQLSCETKRLEGIYSRKLLALSELRKALFQKAFSGELTGDPAEKAMDEAVA